MLSKKPLFSLDLTGKLLVTFLTGLLLSLPNSSFSQNTKGDRPGTSPGPTREISRSKSKSGPARASRGQVRSANPRKSGLFKNLLDQKSSGAPAGERASVSPKRIKPPRTASQTTRAAEEVVKPFVNLNGYTPPAREQADRSGRTASGKRLITRQPSRSVNIYEPSGPRPKYGAPERPREERPYAGNRTASGKKIVKREPSDQSRNLYLGRQKFVVNPSPKPKPSENISSRQGRVQRTTSLDRASSGNASGGIGRSASKTFVTSPKNNVYWGKFSPQRGQVTTDMYGRPLRKKDFQTASNETLPSDTVPGVNRITQTTTSANKKETANRSATRSGLAWQGDISGKKLRSASADPRRNGPAELQKQALNIGGLSGKNTTAQSRRSGTASGAGALLKAGGKAYLNNSAKAFGAGSALTRVQKMGAAGITKGNMRTSARLNSGLQNQRNAARMDVNKNLVGSYSGNRRPAYGGSSSGGNLKLFRKSGDELMKNSGSAKNNGVKIYGVSGGLVKGNGKVDPSAIAKAPLKKDRPRRSSSRENMKDSGLQARVSAYKFKRSRSERIEPGATAQSKGSRPGLQTGGLKRSTIGTVRIYEKGRGSVDAVNGLLRTRNAGNEKYQALGSSRRSGLETGGLKRSTIGTVQVYGRKGGADKQGLFRSRKSGPGNYLGSGSIQRPGLETGGLKRLTIGTVRVSGKQSGDPNRSGMYKTGSLRQSSFQSLTKSQRPGIQSDAQRRSVIGSVKVYGNTSDRLISREGLYRLQKISSSDYNSLRIAKRPGIQTGSMARTTIGTAMVAGKKNYPAETRKRNMNSFRLNAGDMDRLNTFKQPADQANDFSRFMTFSRPAQKYDQLNIRQKELGLRRVNVGRYPRPKIDPSEGEIYFNFGAGSPLTRSMTMRKNTYETRNRIASRDPQNVSGIGKQRISTDRRQPTLAGGFVVKVKAPSIQNRSKIESIPYKPPVVGTSNKGITEKASYPNPDKMSTTDWKRVSMNYRAWKLDEQQLSNAEGLKGKFPQGRYVRHPEANADALKVREPDQAFIRMGLMQSNVRMKKMETPSFHPDYRFAQLKEDNAEGEKSLKTSIRLVFAKAFGRNDLQPSNVKEKMRRPRYDPREVKIWYD